MNSLPVILLGFVCGGALAADLKLMSYNMYGWNAMGTESWKKENLFKTIRASGPDLLGVQEVEGHQWETAGAIGSGYGVVDDGFGSHAIIYKESALTLQGFGLEQIWEEDQWGARYVTWSQFVHSSGKLVDHFNTHLCVCSQSDLGKSARRLGEVMAAHRRPNSVAILTGDFNVFDGTENSEALRYLRGELGSNSNPLEDTYRVFDPSGTAETFPGVKIDYILADQGTPVSYAHIDHETVPYGQASDHWGISATIQI